MTEENPTTARDLLVPLNDYPHARESQTLAEAVAMLETRQIQFDGRISMPRVLLVLDEDNHLLGSLRRRDILRGVEPEFHDELDTTHPEAHFKAEIDPNLTELIPADDAETLAQKLSRPIGELAIEMRAQVNIDDSLMKIVRELVGNDTHIAAVLDDGNVVGDCRRVIPVASRHQGVAGFLEQVLEALARFPADRIVVVFADQHGGRSFLRVAHGRSRQRLGA